MATTCTYCSQKAIPGGYIQPPMCVDHHAMAIVISLLKSRGALASLENIRLLAQFYPKTGLDPDRIPALLEPMKEAVLNGEHT